MSGEEKVIRGNDRISQLTGRPDIADDVAQIRAAMAEADRHTPCASARPEIEHAPWG